MSSTRQFGIVTSLTGLTAGIVVNSLDFNESAESAEARDDKGKIIDIAGYSRKTTVSVTGVVDTAKGSLVRAGSVLSLGGKNYLIDSVSKKESNTAFVEVTISAQTADNAEIYAIDSSNS